MMVRLCYTVFTENTCFVCKSRRKNLENERVSNMKVHFADISRAMVPNKLSYCNCNHYINRSNVNITSYISKENSNMRNKRLGLFAPLHYQ